MISTGHAGPPGLTAWAGLKRWSRWHPGWIFGTVALAAWVGILLLHSRPAHQHASWLGLQNGWLVMVAAMMIPPALPMARRVARNSLRHRRQRAIALFAAASLGIWVIFGLVAVTAVNAVAPSGRLVGACLLLAAAWELTPFKTRFLKACHRMIPLPPDDRKADRACLKLGLQYSGACFGSSWALMLPMALTGHPSLGLMVFVSSVAVAEEVAARGYRWTGGAAVALAAVGVMVLVAG